MLNRYKTCLLIDDNFIDNLINRKILLNAGFAEEIIVFESALEALDELKQQKVKAEVIFLDIRMPVMNGFQFLEAFDKLDEQITNGVKVFMLTSSYNPADYNTSFASKHVYQYIHKPLNLKTLKEL